MLLQLKNTTLRINTILLLIGITFCAFFFNSFTSGVMNDVSKKKYDFSGTNSLYIEINEELHFNWITPKKETGIYELTTLDNKVIASGKTEVGNVHTVSVSYTISEPVIFKFGGETEGIHQIKLRPNVTKEVSVFNNVDSLYVVGDVHGRYTQLINLLQKSHVINSELNWIAGKANLVFLGDLFDRGNDVTKVLWFIYDLEQKAEEKGGKVHLVLGNHEIMTLTKDLRYLGTKEAMIAGAYQKKYDYLFHPTNSFLGSWLSSKASILKIDKNLFAHGGIVDLGTNSITSFNQTVHTYMLDPMFLDIGLDYDESKKYDYEKWREMEFFFNNPNSPFWYRGYVNCDTLHMQLTNMLKKYDSNIHIVAHTPLENISQKYDGKLLTTDLHDAATQLLFLTQNKDGYAKYRINQDGKITKVKQN